MREPSQDIATTIPLSQAAAEVSTRRRRSVPWWHALVAILGFVPPVVLWLHSLAILPVAWEYVPITAIQPLDGHSYVASLGDDWMSRERTGDSPAQLFENGVALPRPNAILDDVAKLGDGRFAVQHGYVYFSTSDNSDPRANNRSYELLWPAKPPPTIRAAITTLWLVALLSLGIAYRTLIWRLLHRPPLWFSASLFVGITLATRLWYFVDVSVPGIYGDSTSYYALVRSIDAGEWPEFSIRTPGYPIFLTLVFAIADSLRAVVIAQTVLMMAASLMLIKAFHTIRPWLAPWAALGMSIYASGLWVLEHDTALLSDSPYSSSIILALAFLTMALVTRKAAHFVLASLVMAVVILFRPAGMFLFVIYAMCIGYLFHNRYPRRSLVGFAVPLPAVMVLLCAYNYTTFGAFSLTAFGESQIAFATFTFWEDDPEYPEPVRGAIQRTQEVMRKRLTDEQRYALRHSWDYVQLSPIFLSGFHYPALDQASTIGGENNYLAAREWIRKVSLDSIAKNPDLYLKFVLTQLWLQYFFNIEYQEDFLTFLRGRVLDVYATDKYTPGKGDPFYVEMAKEYASLPPKPTIRIERHGASATAVIEQTSASRRLFIYALAQHRRWFSSVNWVWLYFATLSLASIRLILSRGRHLGAYIAFTMTISLFGASLLIALVEYGGYRYSYVMEFVYYLPLGILPFLNVSTPLHVNGPRHN